MFKCISTVQALNIYQAVCQILKEYKYKRPSPYSQGTHRCIGEKKEQWFYFIIFNFL